MPVYPPSPRLWQVGPGLCPQDVIAAAPAGYTSAAVYGGFPLSALPDPDSKLTPEIIEAWLTSIIAELPAKIGMTPEAAGTLIARRAGSSQYTLFWDPTGQVTPSDPMPVID